MNAPVRRVDGHPDLSGIWEVDSPKYLGNLAAGIKPADMPFQPCAATVYKERSGELGKDDPAARCVPDGIPKLDVAPNTPYRIVQLPDQLIFLYKRGRIFRQVFTDGRALPEDPKPTFMGYSVGQWDNDTMVMHVAGFNDVTWLDDDGHPHTDAMRLTERFRRRDFGHLSLQIVVDDPKAYTKPWVVNVSFHILPDTELIEYFCEEDEKDAAHLKGK